MKVVAESLRAYGVDATGADLARDDDTGAAACREALRFLAEQCRAANQRRPAEQSEQSQPASQHDGGRSASERGGPDDVGADVSYDGSVPHPDHSRPSPRPSLGTSRSGGGREKSGGASRARGGVRGRGGGGADRREWERDEPEWRASSGAAAPPMLPTEDAKAMLDEVSPSPWKGQRGRDESEATSLNISPPTSTSKRPSAPMGSALVGQELNRQEQRMQLEMLHHHQGQLRRQIGHQWCV